ncbi:MAG: DUF3313 domain-containing protein [Syntrophobacteraceae bacterium]
MSRKSFQIAVFLLAAACLGLMGCEAMKAKPSQGTGFVPMKELAAQAEYPFNKAWLKAGVDWDKYKTIYIKDVNTKYLMEANWWQQNFRHQDMERDTQTISRYMREKFRESFKNDPKRLYKVLNAPEPGSLTLEMALTELVPSNPALEAASIAAPYGGGVVVQVAARESGAKATVAFESRLVDTDTGVVLFMAADREQGKVAPVNLRALTWYGEANVIIDEWADQFVQVANKHPGEVVKAASPFTLMPW